jgi:hypothetical protein
MITSDEKTITITDQNAITTIDKEELPDEIAMLDETNDNIIQPLGLYDNVPKYTSWTTYSSYYSNKSLNVATASLIAGILVGIYGGPVIGVIVTAASYYAGMRLLCIRLSRFIK